MCGRFTLTATPEALNQLFPLFDNIDIPPNYNVAPTHNVLAVRLHPDTERPEPAWLRWGLIPSWADDIRIGYKLINARSETAASKPAFRSAFKHRHCLVLADGFYEWKKAGKAKQPFHIHLRDRQPFAFAGLWEKWNSDHQVIESCTILTTAANELLKPLHERMPVIVDPARYQHWLTAVKGKDNGQEALGTYPVEAMAMNAVSSLVNNVRNNVAECMRPVDMPEALF